MKEEEFKTLEQFIEREIANSEDQYELTVGETKEIFRTAIKANEEVTGKTIDLTEFHRFLGYYKIMKVVEKVSEEVRTEKYLTAMRKIHNERK